MASFNATLKEEAKYADDSHARGHATRDNVLQRLKEACAGRAGPRYGVSFEPAGSSRQRLQVRGNRLDYDILMTIGVVGVPLIANLEAPGLQLPVERGTLPQVFSPSGAGRAESLSNSTMLNWLKDKVQRHYVDHFGGAFAEIANPSVVLKTHSCSFDLLPAFAVANCPGWYYIPAGGNVWKRTNPSLEHDMLNLYAAQLTNLKNVLRMLKYMKNKFGADIPSATFLHAVHAAMRPETRAYFKQQWDDPPLRLVRALCDNRVLKLNWRRAVFVLKRMRAWDGVVPHMLNPPENIYGPNRAAVQELLEKMVRFADGEKRTPRGK